MYEKMEHVLIRKIALIRERFDFSSSSSSS